MSNKLEKIFVLKQISDDERNKHPRDTPRNP